MNIKSKVVAALALAIFVLPLVSFAQTTSVSQQQSQLKTLMAELESLELASAATPTGSGASPSASANAPTNTTTRSACHTFNSNLTIGSMGAAVSALQTELKNDGESVIVTGTFDNQTAAAVSAFQEKYASVILTPNGLTVGTGYVGAATRSELNSFFGCKITPISPCPAYGCNGPEPTPSSTPIIGIIPTSTPSLTVTIDPTTPLAGTIVMGSIGNTLGVFQFVNTQSIENIKIRSLTITDSVSASVESPLPSLGNLTFWSGSTDLGTSASPVKVGTSLAGAALYSYVFNFPTPIIVPEGNSVSLALKGNVPPYSSGAATEDSKHQLFIGSSNAVTAIGATSNEAATVTITNAVTNTETVLRSTMAFSVAPLGGNTDNPADNPLGFDNLGTITLTANTAGSIEPGNVTVNFNGSALTSGLLNSASLFAQNGANVILGNAIRSINTTAGTATWTFNTGTSSPSIITAGTSATFLLAIDTAQIAKLPAGAVPSLTASIANSLGLTYTDATDGKGTSGSVLSPSNFPAVINNITYTVSASSTNKNELTVAQNPAVGTQTVIPGFADALIGSYSFTASAVEGVNVNTVDILTTPGTTSTLFQNLKLVVNGTQFGATQALVKGGTTYVFSATPFSIPAGSTVNVNVYADVLSSANINQNPATIVSGYSAIGATSFTAINSTSSRVYGQAVDFAPPDALTVAIDSSNPSSGQIVQNSIGNTLAVFRFTATTNGENIKVTQVNVVDAITPTNSKASLNNLQLWNGSTLLGTAASPTLDAAGTGYIYTFNSFNTPLIVPHGNAVSLTLKGDAGSYSNGSLTDGSNSTFEIATTTDATNNTPAFAVVAIGVTSFEKAAVTLSNAKGNSQQTVRTVLSITGTPVTKLPPASFQQLGTITLTANSAGDALVSGLKITFNGIANAAFMKSIVLHDPNGNDIVGTDGLATSTMLGTTKTWTFLHSTNPLVVTAGSSYSFEIFGDLSQIPAIANMSQVLSGEIYNTADFSYYDGTSGSPILLNLNSSEIPVTVVSLTTPVGGQPLATDSNAQTAIEIQSLQSVLAQLEAQFKASL